MFASKNAGLSTKILFSDAIGADVQCFERFNPTGNFNGHCGKDDKTGSFAKCLPE